MSPLFQSVTVFYTGLLLPSSGPPVIAQMQQRPLKANKQEYRLIRRRVEQRDDQRDKEQQSKGLSNGWQKIKRRGKINGERQADRFHVSMHESAKVLLSESRQYLGLLSCVQGRPSPLRQLCIFSPISDSPLFSENFENFSFRKCFQLFRKKFCFVRQNCWWPFPVFLNLFLSPNVCKFLPVFLEFTCFLPTLRVLVSPAFTMMHLCITQCTNWTPLHVSAILR